MTAQHKRDTRERRFELPAFAPWGSSSTGRHSKPQKGSRRAGSPVPAPKAPKPPATRSAGRVARTAIPPMTSPAQGRGRTRSPRKQTALDNRPYEVNAPSSPRGRFSGASAESRVAARTSYEKGQRAAQHATQRAGTKSRGAATGGVGQPKAARSRFKGEASSAQKNATAKQLHPHAPTVRGKASRPAAALPTAKKTPARVAQHSADPKPQLSGASFFFGGR